MKFAYRLGADAIFTLHLLLVVLVVFGWTVPTLWPIYMVAMVITLASDVVFGYCIFSKWEFDLRKKVNPDTNYNFTWTTYYTYKVTNYKISDRFYKRAAIVALTLCILINIYFKFIY